MTARVSVAMATYNGAKYLQEQLNSFLQQLLLPDELIACDDGSTDATVEILEAFREQAPFDVQIFRNEVNLGYVKNFEKALSLCTGEIIFLSDQDDVWFPEKVRTMVKIFSLRPDIFVLQADMKLADEALNPSRFTQLGNILSLGQSRDTFVTGCGTAIRREWLEVALPIPSDVVAHDAWLHQLALPLGVRALHEEPLQYYRRHGDNVSNWLASRQVSVTELDAFLEHGFSDATKGWLSELERVKATVSRLTDRTPTLQLLALSERKPRAVDLLVRRMGALRMRVRNMAVPRFRRWIRVFLMWAGGGYDHFAGWKSAAKDVFRP